MEVIKIQKEDIKEKEIRIDEQRFEDATNKLKYILLNATQRSYKSFGEILNKFIRVYRRRQKDNFKKRLFDEGLKELELGRKVGEEEFKRHCHKIHFATDDMRLNKFGSYTEGDYLDTMYPFTLKDSKICDNINNRKLIEKLKDAILKTIHNDINEPEYNESDEEWKNFELRYGELLDNEKEEENCLIFRFGLLMPTKLTFKKEELLSSLPEIDTKSKYEDCPYEVLNRSYNTDENITLFFECIFNEYFTPTNLTLHVIRIR